MLFDFLKDILYNKTGDKLDNIDNLSSFVPFMINRWISMYSPEYAVMINCIGNKGYNYAHMTKNEYYNFLISVIPKGNFKKINYIKKTKVEKEEDISEIIDTIANGLQLSRREVLMYIEQTNTKKELIEKFSK